MGLSDNEGWQTIEKEQNLVQNWIGKLPENCSPNHADSLNVPSGPMNVNAQGVQGDAWGSNNVHTTYTGNIFRPTQLLHVAKYGIKERS